MVWPQLIMAGASIGSALLNKKSAKDAGNAAGGAGDAAIAEQRAAREDFNRRTAPFRQIGLSASSPILEQLGIVQANPEIERLREQLAGIDERIASGSFLEKDRPQFVNGVGSESLTPEDIENIHTRRKSELDARNAAALADLERERESLTGRITGFETEDAKKLQELQARGPQGIDEINPLVGFLRKEGFEDIQESAAARGKLNSGGTLRDLTEFNTNLSATVVPQLQQQRFNQLFSLLGLGQSTSVGQGSAGLNTASNIGNIQQGVGVAKAQSGLNQGSAIGGGISDLAGLFGVQQSGFFNKGGGVPAGRPAAQDLTINRGAFGNLNTLPSSNTSLGGF